ncbi:MAG: S41 family peptidase [Holophaga sp.]|nr:S41 family peptidase [Holophaga sp.]
MMTWKRTRGFLQAQIPLALLAAFILACGRPVIPVPSNRPLFAPVAGPFDAALKARVVGEIGQELGARAYAGAVDFSGWSQRVAKVQGTLDQAETPEAFSKALNEVLRGYKVSHLSVSAELERGWEAPSFRHYGFRACAIPEGALVADVTVGGSAAKAGLRRGDVLTHLNGQPIRVKDIQLCGDLLRLQGKRRTQPIVLEVACGQAPLHGSASLSWVNPEVALIRIPSFRSPAYDLAAIQKMVTQIQKSKGLVLDLRFNEGGDLANFRHLATHLWPGGNKTLAWSITKPMEEAYRKVHGRPGNAASIASWAKLPYDFVGLRGPDRYAGPLVVLCDRWSASAAEMLLAAVQELGRAKVVGMRTSGQVLEVPGDASGRYGCALSGGFRLVYPSALVLSPRLNIYEGKGVSPDVELDLRTTLDDEAILAKALELLR